MATLIIGDFRVRQLQQYQTKSKDITNNYTYLLEDTAEYSWFSTTALAQLPLRSLDIKNVVIALGFNDCAYSCVWNAFNINQIATNYAKTINKLIEQYSSLNFYICSVNPVDAAYPFAEYTNGSIPVNVLDKKINQFNTKIKNNCKAAFIDCYSYLTSTSFDTRDGVRYVPDTCKYILSYVTSQISSTDGSLFIPRTVKPEVNANDIESDLYWLSESKSGFNPFAAQNAGDTLPNCTAYAWGRFYEILGSEPKLSTGNAAQWYLNTSDGYSRGQTPVLGAIACWQSSGSSTGAGFVAVVEKINMDGSIETSESDKDKAIYWQISRRTNEKGNWGADSKYTFQGFIYCPITAVVQKENLCTKNSYSISIDEMKPNAQYIWQYLGARGWSMNAVAGLLGNLQQESKMSPAIWESTISGSSVNGDGTQTLNMSVINDYFSRTGRYPGYGLVQWTPYSKYTDWCKASNLNYWDMDSQLQRIEYEVKNKIQWIAKPSKGYDLSFNDFISSTKDAAWLAAAFAFCYERPARSTGTLAEQDALRKERGDYGKFWYNYLNTLTPVKTDTQLLQVYNFRLDRCEPSKITASFIAHGGVSGKYMLTEDGKIILNESLETIKDGLNTFIIKSKIAPNTEYKLNLTVQGANDKSFSKEFLFSTPQDYPESVKTIKLSCEDLLKTPNSTFKLDIVKPKYLGYWKSASGYDLQLFINNKCIATNVSTDVKDIKSELFTIKDKFNYSCNIGDVVQVGIRVWVEDDKGNRLYDNLKAKMSEAICLLNSPIKAYLNIN